MATLALMAVGSAVGSALLPSGVGLLGAALTGAQVGSALGGALGGLLDQRLLGPGSTAVQGPRLQDLRLTASTEGAPIPRLFGSLRLGGQVLWASRFQEHESTREVGGGKGGPSSRVTEYSYSISFAVGLCEGPIAGVDRIWADGQPMALEGVAWRLHRGGEDQTPDPLILALEGASEAPAYRGLAYVVFENLPLAPYGNRLPQISVEVRRAPASPHAPSLLLRGATLIPGAGEWVLNADPVILDGPSAAAAPSMAELVAAEGRARTPNLNASAEASDLVVALDQLQDQAPNLESVALVASWFGDDLRCGACRIRPGVEQAEAAESRAPWAAGGVGRSGARLLASEASGRAVYGGTPADAGVVSAIRELRRRGLRVVFYPFVMMEILGGNALPDPWTGAASQPAFPWRGRITLSNAPGRPGSPDKTPAAATEVAAFFGTALPAHFGAWNGATIPYHGPADWGLRRQILHYAHLCAAAGGVDAFLIGSEMRSLTQIRSGPSVYPAVAAFKALAADVRAILGPETKISYAADWSEYFGHHPQDGSGDVHFHLDPLWADANVDFVGIDNYLPMADWREGRSHADAAWGSAQNLDYLRSNIEGGEGYDWFYASPEDRAAQIRSPIADGAYEEPWIFRPKDLRNWWSRPHHDRPGGARKATPTAWIPGSKPLWFTECGCPAVDKGANQPNVFYDPKSSESLLPYFSSGLRDDAMQSAYLSALLSYWSDPAKNPPGMLDAANIHVWTWDARPYPHFPLRTDLWSDGPNWALGHWLTGRLHSAPLAEVVREICVAAGEPEADVSRLSGSVAGYALDRALSAREALTPLALVHGFDAVESAGRLSFVPRGAPAEVHLAEADLVLPDSAESEAWSLTRAQESDLPAAVRLLHLRPEAEDRRGAVEAAAPGASGRRVEVLEAPMALDASAARIVAERWLAEAWAGRERARFALPPSRLSLQPGDVMAFGAAESPAPPLWRIDRLEESLVRTVEATRVEASLHRPASLSAALPAAPRRAAPGGLVAELADLPMGPVSAAGGVESPLWAAAFAAPWTGPALLWRETAPDEWSLAARLERPAAMGRLLEPLPPASPHLWTRGPGLLVGLAGGAEAPPLLGRPPSAVLDGANAAAIRAPDGRWEILQFSEARLEAPGVWRLGPVLRGRAGTEAFSGAALPEGSRFLLLDKAVVPVAAPLGAARKWRFAPASLTWADPRALALAAGSEGAAWRPYAPARLRARPEASGDLRISWLRRSRGDPGLWDHPGDPPLNEEREAYRLEIRSGGALRRAETLASPDFLYAAAARAADGAEFPLEISVAQISARIGAGAFSRILIDG